MLNAVKEIQLLLTVAVCVEYILWSNLVPIQLYNAEPIENKNNSANKFRIFLFILYSYREVVKQWSRKNALFGPFQVFVRTVTGLF